MTHAALRRRWWWAVGGASALLVAAHLVLPSVRGGTGRSLWLGVAGAGLLLVCALLGARKRFLRLRLGSVGSWTAAHNALGVLALVFGLLHCDFQTGGVLTTALLLTLGLSVVSGLVGAALQASVPKMMTSRLSQESGNRHFRALFAHHWRRIHSLVVEACGPIPEADRALRHLEQRAGIADVDAPSPGGEAEAETGADERSVAAFYTTVVVPYLQSRNPRQTLGTESGARLAIDALRANVRPSLRPLVSEMERIIDEARTCAEERRLHRLVFDWQLLHIPLAVFVVLLATIHAFAALYY